MLDSDQERWKSVITEVVQRRQESYHVFVKALGQMSVAERRAIRFASLKMLWQEFPARLDLDENVGNAGDPGDGKVYREEDILEVASILKAFCDAWSVATVKADDVNADDVNADDVNADDVNADDVNATSPETVRKVRKIPNMAKICLILRGMKQERLLDYFCDKSKDDNHLPLRLDSVKEILEPEDADHAGIFVTEQYRAVCRTWNDGEHIEIAEKEPLPLVFMSEYMLGANAMVRRCRHAFTNVYYACKEQISHETRSHLLQEIARLRKLSHRHIVQFVKSYQRGDQYGILLEPAVITNLKMLLGRYRGNSFGYDGDSGDRRRDHVVLKPITLTAFGCLSRGLAHIHGCNILHKDIKPANILYEKASLSNPARFLWANFGNAHDFDNEANSDTTSRLTGHPRYWAPEVIEEVVACKPRGDSNHDDSDDDSPEQFSSLQGKPIRHGTSSDIYSFGIVFLEMLNYLIAEGFETSISGDFEARMPFWKNNKDLQEWAETQIRKLDHDSPLKFLFQLSLRMIACNPEDRPKITQIVQDLAKAGPQYFCTACHHEPEDLTPQAGNTEEQVGRGDDNEHSHSVSSDQEPGQQEHSSASPYAISTELRGNADEALPDIKDILLKDFRISSQAFTNLPKKFRRMVYPDPLMAIRDTISDAYEPCPGKSTAVFNVRWELAQYLETELGYHTTLQQREHLLESVLTVSGTASKAYATTAAEYMRWKWPRSNFKLLETIEQLLKGQSAGEPIIPSQ